MILTAALAFSLADLQPASPRLIQAEGPWNWQGSIGRFQWPAAGFRLRFGGGRATLVFHDEAPGTPHPVKGRNSNHLWVRVDSGPWQTHALPAGRSEITVESSRRIGLVEVRKRTESSVGAVRWLGVRAARVIPPLGGRRLTLDLYGDSNSCGYGVEENRREDRYSPASQNAMLAYGPLAAERLGLHLNLIAASGWGIFRGYGGQTDANIPRVADRTLLESEPGRGDRRTPPDLIMVLLGDDDFAKDNPGPEFEAGYRRFVADLLARHPGVPILLTVGPAMADSPDRPKRSRVSAVIDALAADHPGAVRKLVLPRMEPSWGYGADWHISRKGNEILADALERELRAL
ncbi:MAG: GDSL-type esterase/lipase family protein, partial [Fimbriimonadaceae bacterium]|nr:GDSL-type esterase/lipase family protein [Fimbriimonadaceae bacterium]